MRFWTFLQKCNNNQKRDELVLRTPSRVGKYNSTRVDERRKCWRSTSRDKNEGTYRSGEGVGGPAMWPRIWVTTGREREETSARIINGMKNEQQAADSQGKPFFVFVFFCGHHDGYRARSYCAVWKTLPSHKGSDRITSCEYGKAPTRQLHSNTHCCLWSGHTRKQSNSLALSSISKKWAQGAEVRLTSGSWKYAVHPSCDSPNTSRRFALGASNAWLVKTRRASSQHS